MPKAIDLTGRRFKRLTVIRLSEDRRRCGHRIWICLCDCGKETKSTYANLTSGNTQSCGCLRQELYKQTSEQHQRRLATGVMWCNRCKQNKQLSEFYKWRTSGRKTGSCYCTPCDRERAYEYRYGVSKEFKSNLVAEQNFKCANPGCGLQVNEDSHLDHCHRTDQIRGVLCRECNLSLGMLGESRDRIIGLAEYLSRY